ncbi:hypothetical protein [Fructilactobacillus fructivorans]|uniref:hypothetical protein n=1 Tax=Fructilactobacillus fructivorans TaxID=1614 RepID=UPI0002196D1D|nr:hypothetical protein [Fructilactobacillus fructivorans]KRK57226.1 hypothetical protein FC73_GL001265 [Fructilactobacillus fructivorans]KRN12060.1 hypothetical protein IV37_GL001284 [Fructilactobacillus fructivorans]KRN40471.1 hypothetical protein IV51_GL000179 [Fructilactobacillus fructivorans]
MNIKVLNKQSARPVKEWQQRENNLFRVHQLMHNKKLQLSKSAQAMISPVLKPLT